MTLDQFILTLQAIQEDHGGEVDVEFCFNGENTGTIDNVAYVESYDLRYAYRGCPVCLIYADE